MRGIHIIQAALLAAIACATTYAAPQASGQTTKLIETEAPHAKLRKQTAEPIQQAFTFLRSSQQDNGAWLGHTGGADPAVTALVVKAFIHHPDYGVEHEAVTRGIRFVLQFQQPDGGIYDPDLGYANYTTSIAVTMLAATNDDVHKDTIEKARKYLVGNQWDESKEDLDGTQVDTGHPWYGGAGYAAQKRPDLSNTQMMLDALHASGLPTSDPAYQKALRFIHRCQMQSQLNDLPFARGADDGGFIYSPANGGESKAGTVQIGEREFLRSYGSMTYAGFKSLLYAGVERDDPRVRTAFKWIQKHYTLEQNPNMPWKQSAEGLYYYYHVFAKALNAWGEDTITDSDGNKHNWRAELCDVLLERQRDDGSWINDEDRWHEGNANLVTAYALLALEETLGMAVAPHVTKAIDSSP